MSVAVCRSGLRMANYRRLVRSRASVYRQVIELFVGHGDALALIAHARKCAFRFHAGIVKCHPPHQPHRLFTLSAYGFKCRPNFVMIHIQNLASISAFIVTSLLFLYMR